MSKIEVGDRVIRTRHPSKFDYSGCAIEYKGRYTVQKVFDACVKLKELPEGESIYGIRHFKKIKDGTLEISENYNI